MSTIGLRRKLVGELMDDPALDHAEHCRALEGLRNINRASHAADSIAKPLLDFARRHQLTQLSMLDVACGGGDVPVAVVLAVKKQHIAIDLTLMDKSPLAIQQAGDAARAADVQHQMMLGDAVATLPEHAVDVVTNSLFLHHLTRGEVIAVLTNMRKSARRAVIISDLRRSAFGYVIAWVGCRILSNSPVVHYDGPVSVRAAWTVAEMRSMAEEAGMTGTTVCRAWPWRILLQWERTPAGGVGDA